MIPHDPGSYTQGLLYRDGWLYESSGGENDSALRKIDPGSGEVVQTLSLGSIWAEGIAALGDRLTVLTWKSERAHLYSLPDLRPRGSLAYAGEGWGLAARDQTYFMTNGTNAIVIRDEEFHEIGVLHARMNATPAGRLNDLEVVGDTLYANVYYSTDVLEISVKNGEVTSIIDCALLLDIEHPAVSDHVLNGIAHNPQTGTFFVTGKHWNRIFEVNWDARDGAQSC